MRALERWIEDRVRGRRVAVVGIGNRLRGDDAAGPQVVDRLGAGGGWTVLDAGTVPENFLGPLRAAAVEVVLFVDGMDHGGRPGAWCAGGTDALAARAADTHAPSLRLLAELLRRGGVACWVIGIQPRSTRLGAGLSPEVAAGAVAVADALAAVRASTAERASAERTGTAVPEATHA